MEETKKSKNIIKSVLAMFVMVMAFTVTGITAQASGLTQTNQTKNSITVSWTAPTNVINYTARIATDYSSISSAKGVNLSATATSYTFTNLTPGTEYYIKISYTYKSSYSNKTYDSYYSLSDAITLPGKVTGVKQSTWWYYANSVDFTWDKQSAAKYEYVVKTNKGKIQKKNLNGSSSNTGSCSTKNTVVYSLQVRAYVTINDKNYYGDWSDTAYLFCQPMITEKKSSLKNGKLKITWNKVSGVTGYDIYVSNKEKSGYKKVKSVSSKKNSITLTKFKNTKIKKSKKYYVYIVAKKKVGKTTYTSGKHYTYEMKQKRLNWTFN